MQTSPDFSGLRFNGDGLVPAIVQQDETHRVLMMAWVNREALERTLQTGFMHYWSRSRGKLWFKGETSGHRQEVVAWYKDCDGDTLLFTVRQHGGACHTGYESCFFQRLHRDGSNSPIEEEPLFDAGDVYQTAGHQSGPDAGKV